MENANDNSQGIWKPKKTHNNDKEILFLSTPQRWRWQVFANNERKKTLHIEQSLFFNARFVSLFPLSLSLVLCLAFRTLIHVRLYTYSGSNGRVDLALLFGHWFN